MRALLVLALALSVLPLAADPSPDPQPNPLAGHEVTATMPGLVLVLTDTQAGATWTGPLVLEVDGQPVARVTLPMASAPLPARRWGALDWLKAAGIAVLAALAERGAEQILK